MASVSNGVNSVRGNTVVGRTIGEIRDDAVLSDLLDLHGGERATARFSGSDGFENVDDDFEVTEESEVRFSRSAGEKGSN